MYEEQHTQNNVDWAGTSRLILAVVAILLGFLFAYIIGGIEWMKWYAIIFIPIVGIFMGIYAIMALMTNRDLGMARAFGDILHAHSQSGAQQAKAVTEVIRGANAMNKADADVQTAMMKQFGNIGAAYEKELAKMRIAMVEQEGRFSVLDNPQDNEQKLLTWDGEGDEEFPGWQ